MKKKFLILLSIVAFLVCISYASVSYGATCATHTVVTETVPADMESMVDGFTDKYCSKCYEHISTTRIYCPSVIKLSQTSYGYDGKAKKPTLIATLPNGKELSKDYYSISYSNNTKIGTATATITFKGKYRGTVKKTFKIRSKAEEITSLKYVSTGKMTIKWKKHSSANGYLLQYSISSKFAKKNTVNVLISDNTVVTKTISCLPSRTYYVRVCSYKTTSGKKVRGEYSPVKSVKITKGASLKSIINYTKTDLSGKDTIYSLTKKGVDISKYSTTYDRIKAIYNWHAKHYKDFESCVVCNTNFNNCLSALYGKHKKYDEFIWLAAGKFQNRSGSKVVHKWSIIYLQGVPYIFDPRMQGYTGNYTGTDYWGIKTTSTTGKRFLFEEWYSTWGCESTKII